MLSVTKAYLCSAFMEYTGLEKLDGIPNKISSRDPKDLEEIIGSFVDEYVMLEFDVEKALRQQKEQAQQNANTVPVPVTRAQLRAHIQPGTHQLKVKIWP